MRLLRQNTATIVTVGPFYDKTDGVTIETGLTITNERISFTVDGNDGSAPTLVLDNVTGATSGTSNDLNYITNNDAGLMQIELAGADVNYVGRAMLSITDAANHCPVFHEFTILPAQVYDSLILGTDLLDANASQLGGTAQTGRDIGANVLLSSGTGAGQISLSSGTVTVGTNNDKTGYALSAAAIDAILDDAVEGSITARQALRGIFAACLNKLSGAATTTVSIRDAADAKDRIVATVDADGNRSAVTLDLT